MPTFARIYLPESGQPNTPPDNSTIGWMQVVYKGEVRWAKPSFALGSYTPPSGIFLRKFAESFAVAIYCEDNDIIEERGDHLIYTGFIPLNDVLPQDIEDAYPNKSMPFFSGQWQVTASDDPNDPYIELLFTGDPDNPKTPQAPGATLLRINQKSGQESIELTHYVDGQPTGTSFQLHPDGSVSLKAKGGSEIKLEQNKIDTQINNGAGFKVEGSGANAAFTLGTGNVHAVVYEHLFTTMENLKTWLATHVHVAPSGSTGPPTTAATIPSLATNAKASKVKIPG